MSYFDNIVAHIATIKDYITYTPLFTTEPRWLMSWRNKDRPSNRPVSSLPEPSIASGVVLPLDYQTMNTKCNHQDQQIRNEQSDLRRLVFEAYVSDHH